MARVLRCLRPGGPGDGRLGAGVARVLLGAAVRPPRWAAGAAVGRPGMVPSTWLSPVGAAALMEDMPGAACRLDVCMV